MTNKFKPTVAALREIYADLICPVVLDWSEGWEKVSKAIGSTSGDRPPVPGTEKGSTFQRDHEYARYGTLSKYNSVQKKSGLERLRKYMEKDR